MENGIYKAVQMESMRDRLRHEKSAKLEETKLNVWKEFVKNL